MLFDVSNAWDTSSKRHVRASYLQIFIRVW